MAMDEKKVAQIVEDVLVSEHNSDRENDLKARLPFYEKFIAPSKILDVALALADVQDQYLKGMFSQAKMNEFKIVTYRYTQFQSWHDSFNACARTVAELNKHKMLDQHVDPKKVIAELWTDGNLKKCIDEDFTDIVRGQAVFAKKAAAIYAFQEIRMEARAKLTSEHEAHDKYLASHDPSAAAAPLAGHPMAQIILSKWPLAFQIDTDKVNHFLHEKSIDKVSKDTNNEDAIKKHLRKFEVIWNEYKAYLNQDPAATMRNALERYTADRKAIGLINGAILRASECTDMLTEAVGKILQDLRSLKPLRGHAIDDELEKKVYAFVLKLVDKIDSQSESIKAIWKLVKLPGE